jgi:hypothetical protein
MDNPASAKLCAGIPQNAPLALHRLIAGQINPGTHTSMASLRCPSSVTISRVTRGGSRIRIEAKSSPIAVVMYDRRRLDRAPNLSVFTVPAAPTPDSMLNADHRLVRGACPHDCRIRAWQ